jgi:uncharacterized protein (TIGR02145 family)
VNSQSTNGYYWSATAQSGTVPYSLSFTNTTTNPVSVAGSAYSHAYAIRCVPQPASSPAGEYEYGGLIWAGSNLTGKGVFAQSATSTTNYVSYWGDTIFHIQVNGSNDDPPDTPFTTWENDPCPYGWRVPTEAELRTLVGNMRGNNNPAGAYVTGATRISTVGDPQLFFPGAGYKSAQTGNPEGVPNGYYWSSGLSGSSTDSMPWYLTFTSGNNNVTGSVSITQQGKALTRGSAMSVRCVRIEQ